MINTNCDQSVIENALKNIVKRIGISDTIYEGARPKSVNKKVSDFIVVKIVGNIEDLYTYGETSISIDIFAKELDGGFKNSKKLSLMYQKLITGIKPVEEDIIIITSLRQIADSTDGAGYFVRMTQGKIIIKRKKE